MWVNKDYLLGRYEMKLWGKPLSKGVSYQVIKVTGPLKDIKSGFQKIRHEHKIRIDPKYEKTCRRLGIGDSGYRHF